MAVAVVCCMAASVLSLFFMESCGRSGAAFALTDGDTVRMKYSRLLTVIRHEAFTQVDIADPWHKGKTLHKYVLVPEGSRVEDFPEGTVIRIPLRRCVPFSTVHTSLIAELGRIGAIAGVADRKYIKLGSLQQLCKEGKVADVGDGYSPDIERIIDISPDAMLVSPFENSGGYGKIDELGVPLIECADYMEPTALGRAEWIRFYGMLFGCGSKADSIFNSVDRNYNRLKDAVAKSVARPSAVIDRRTGSVWYMPGGKSTLGSMISDAGISYAFSDDSRSGSLALPFETVLDKCGDADVWIFRYSLDRDITYTDILSEFEGYGQLKAVRNRNCYGCNLERTMFFEETPFHPDHFLSDLVMIFHPEIRLAGNLRYFKPVR
ncbi:ABC transporter substrate-binding protein [Prevotella sp. PMUR]|uniref:ABC transporter substrate-binding protein n=2 Tax=Xylanibacter muris TaxID=2736290 RepID=A0ABX2AQ64_9BACT|nr:ABC transporter substrate-binding protein [Xylanibacter muris]